jgi:D-threo-aldose 1-dehydrogenase
LPNLKDKTIVAETELELPVLGLGVATQGNLFREFSNDEATDVFEAAWNAGLRYFDTAPWYGLGLAEKRVGNFLQSKKDYVLSSKVGWLLREDVSSYPAHRVVKRNDFGFKTATPYNAVYDASYDGFMRSFEESLERLGVNSIDILYIHDPVPAELSVKEMMMTGGRALLELREQGVVKAIGVGMNQWQMPLEFVQTGLLDTVLLAGRYTLLEQNALPLLSYCAKHHIAVVIGGVFNSGLLANPQPQATYNYAAVPEEVLQRSLILKEVCESFGVPLKAAALQFPLRHPAVASVLTAAQTVRQLEENLEAFNHWVPSELWKGLVEHRLLSEEVLTSME